MTLSLAQKPKTQKRGRPQAPKIQQLHLLDPESTEPASADTPQHPLVVKAEKTAYCWHRNRYKFTCAYTGELKGFPFYANEVEFILDHFKGWRSPVDDTSFWAVVQEIVPGDRKGSAGVAA